MFSHEQLDEINRLIVSIIASNDRNDEQWQAVAKRGVLPALEDWSAFGAITNSGELVWVGREPPFEVTPITSDILPLERLVLLEAADRYPSLESLRPQRPEDAVTCPDCSDKPDRSCYCGGLGWMLENELTRSWLEWLKQLLGKL